MRVPLLLPLVCLLAGCAGHKAASGQDPSREQILGAAKDLYQTKKASGLDMTNGPCLGVVLNDWAVDVAHNPRQPVDNEPQNQCEAYRSGRVHHFVELTPEGDLIRMQ